MSAGTGARWAFKEWAGIVEAVNRGEQCLLLRKGGVDEAGGEFRPTHGAFWLWPTAHHEPERGLRDGRRGAPWTMLRGGAPFVGLDTFVVATDTVRLTEEEALGRLEEFHLWRRETLIERFRYREPGLWLIVARAYRSVGGALEIEATAERGGCRTWVDLGEVEASALPALEPSLGAEAFLERRAAILRAAGVEG